MSDYQRLVTKWQTRLNFLQSLRPEDRLVGDYTEEETLINCIKAVAEVIARNVQPSTSEIDIQKKHPDCRCQYTLWTNAEGCPMHDPKLARPVQQPAPNKFASGRDSAESEQNKAGTNSSDPSLRNEPLAISVQQPATEPLIKELREARTAWHKDFGVPVSFPYARFLNAIGAVEDALALRDAPQGHSEPMLKSIEDYRSGYSCGYSDAKKGTRMRDKDAADLFFGIGAPDILDHKERP